MPLNNFRSPRMHVRSIPCSVGIFGAQKNRHYSVSASPMPADVALEICSNGTEGDAAGWISLCPGRGMEMYGVTQTNGVGPRGREPDGSTSLKPVITARAEARNVSASRAYGLYQEAGAVSG